MAINDYCVFTLRQRRFALPLAAVRETVDALSYVPVPWAPPCLLGLVQLRGQIFPQVELSGFLGALPPGRVASPQYLVVEAADLRFIAPVDRMDIRLLSTETAVPHPGASLHPALDATLQPEGTEEKIELIHVDRLRCALARELRFAELAA